MLMLTHDRVAPNSRASERSHLLPVERGSGKNADCPSQNAAMIGRRGFRQQGERARPASVRHGSADRSSGCRCRWRSAVPCGHCRPKRAGRLPCHQRCLIEMARGSDLGRGLGSLPPVSSSMTSCRAGAAERAEPRSKPPVATGRTYFVALRQATRACKYQSPQISSRSNAKLGPCARANKKSIEASGPGRVIASAARLRGDSFLAPSESFDGICRLERHAAA